MKKTVTVVALLLVGLLLADAAWAADEARTTSTRPPKNLKKVGDHWTPWDPPPAGPNDYIIVKGDTLWDLAGKWLQNPFLWPQIWEKNRYVLDSHWIYPGDPIVVPGQPEVVPPEGPPAGDDESAEGPKGPAGAPTGQATRGPAPPPLFAVADPTDLYCSGYVDPEHTPSERRVVGHEMEREHLAEGDVIYVNAGSGQGVRAGETMAVIRPTREVIHPVTGQDLGDYVRRLGRLRVLAAQENTAIAVIEQSCEDILRGDEIVPWSDLASPMLASMPKLERYDVEPTGGAQGFVVTMRDPITAAGVGHLLHTDLGAGAGVAPGTLVNIFRDNNDLPRLMLGRAVVLTVEPGTSTAKIVQSYREIALGDRVEVAR